MFFAREISTPFFPSEIPLEEGCTIGICVEIWHDQDGFFVARLASNNDFIHFECGDDTVSDPRTVGGGRTTYGAITAGVTIKPPKTTADERLNDSTGDSLRLVA